MQSLYLPEGRLLKDSTNISYISSLQGLEKAKEEGIILESVAMVCDTEHNLIVDLNGIPGIIPREECALGIVNGKTRDIAIISRVGKPVCFKVKEILYDKRPPKAILSRVDAQQEATAHYLKNLRKGDVIPSKVTHLEPFGAFVDIGCGIISLIGIENISVSRIFHPSERFTEGQDIYTIISDIDNETGRISLSHKELLGTWEENITSFSCGETVTGIVRSIEDYGIFIELMPNLSGLAEYRSDIKVGQRVAVYIKSIIPERMKIKLTIISVTDNSTSSPMISNYYITEGHLNSWIYTPTCCNSKIVCSDFEE